MADRDDARPEFNPKHRIVGAIVIVALVVIFVPMILSERQPPSEVRGGGEPSARNEVAKTKVVVTPVVPVESPASVANQPATKAAAPAPVTETASKPETKPVAAAEKPAPAKEKTVKVSATAETISKGWVVQVGTFSNTENAIRLRDKLQSHGHTVHAETLTLSGKKAMRLRVGPFRDKEQAARTQAQIRQETGVQGAVRAYP